MKILPVRATQEKQFLQRCNSSELNGPYGVKVMDDKVLVAESGNSRILIWNSFPTVNSQPADIVLGQPSFTACDSNRGLGLTYGDTLSTPSDVWTDGTKVIVSDAGNNRVLVWNTFPTVNAQFPDVVVGQSDFTSNAGNAGFDHPTEWGFYYAFYLTSDGTQLFVADYTNNRILLWNTIPTASGVAADVVLGQTDFTSSGSATT